MTGRPSSFTPELAEEIASLLAEDNTLKEIADTVGVNKSTLIRWMAKHPEFATSIARAREIQADILDDKIAETIAEVKAGILSPDVARVIIYAFQWRAGKKSPKKYGDSTQLRHADADGNKLSFQGILNDIDGGTASLPQTEG